MLLLTFENVINAKTAMSLTDNWNSLKRDMSCLRSSLKNDSTEPLTQQDRYEIIEKIDELRTVIADKRFGDRKSIDLKLANKVYDAVMPLATLLIISDNDNDNDNDNELS